MNAPVPPARNEAAPAQPLAESAADFASAIARYREGDAAAAALLFAEILQRNPNDAQAWRLHGLALVRAGRPVQGLPSLARAVALAPREALAHLHHGIGLLEAGCAPRAAARFRRATTLAPAMPAAWINFSGALLALGQPAAARAAARRALRLAPENAAALHALARGHAALGELAAAQDGLLRALDLAPRHVDGWIDLGLVQARIGRIPAARHAMERALAIDPGHPIAAANRAAFALLTGDAAASIATLRGILAANPDCVAARLNLANALLLERESAEALALLEGAPPPGREGAFWRAHRALALLLRGRRREAAAALDAIPPPYGDAEILIVGHRLQLARLADNRDACAALAIDLQRLIALEGASLFEHRVIACFDLARLRQGEGDLVAAFGHWAEGHRLMARIQPFSRPGMTQFVDASIERYAAAKLQVPAAADADPAPVFVVGLPRSGTTLTEHILDAHALVHGAGERSAVHDLATRLGGPSLHSNNVYRLAALDAEALAEARADFLAALHAEAPEARFIVDKMPANALHLGFLARLLPGAKFILCRRDLRDTGLSIFQHRFFGYHPYAHDLGDLGFYMAEHERLMAHWLAVLPGRIVEVALTDWVGDFAGTLARLEAFLDLPHDPACERFHESRRRVRTASAAQVRQPINARGIGRWTAYAEALAPMLDALEAVRGE